MSDAKITLYGMAEWMRINDSDLFSALTLPEGIEKDLFVDSLLLDAGEFSVLYGDPEFMRKMIGVWGRKYYRTFDKWIKALNVDYDPLYNLDVFEEWEDNGTKSNNSSGSYSRTDGYTRTEEVAEDITDTNDLHNETSGSNITENTRSAFDATTYQPHDKQELTAESQSDDTGDVVRDRDQTTSTQHSGTQTDTHNDSDNGSSKDTHTGHRYGNQGVTMSQQMLEAELDVQKWNLYQHMIDLFVNDFCVAVYV